MLHIIMYRSACRALLLMFGKACDNYMPWDLTAQKPSIRSFRLAKSERSKLSTYEKREPLFDMKAYLRSDFSKGERNIREYTCTCVFLFLVWNFSKRDNRFPRATLRVINMNVGNELERKKDMRGRHSANISIVSGRPSDFLFQFELNVCFNSCACLRTHIHIANTRYSIQWVSEQNYYGSENWKKIENIAETIWEIFEERFSNVFHEIIVTWDFFSQWCMSMLCELSLRILSDLLNL